MKADYLSYKRATGVALLGAGIQVALGSALLIFGLLRADDAAFTASIFVLLGVVVWVALAIVFDQHRRERIEAIEQENFAADDLTSSSVFDEASGDLRVAAKRLETLYKFMMPAISLVMGAALVVGGVLRLTGGSGSSLDAVNQGARAAADGASGAHGWAIAIGIGVAVIGFVFARFTSGMARAKVWENLRGGSVYAVGSSLFGLFIAIAQFADIAGASWLLSSLDQIFAIALIVLGAEIFVSFVLDIYRPRKAGEYPRPAFDSRLLGFVAAPDRIAESISDAINYQFGFEVTGSWFYRLLSKSFIWLILVGGVGSWLMTSFIVVDPHQRGLLLVNGSPADKELGPGLHVKPPWPFGRVVIPEYIREERIGEGDAARSIEVVEETATGVRVLELAGEPIRLEGPVLWQDETLRETLMVVQPGRRATSEGGGRALSLATARVPLYYSVKPGEAQAFIMLGRDPEARDEILRRTAQRVLVRELGSRTVEEIIGGGRDEIRRSLQEGIEAAFAQLNPDANGQPMGSGVDVLFVGLEDARPPREAAAAFEQVFEASQKSTQSVTNAQRDRATMLAETVGSESQARAVIEALDAYDRLRLSGADEAEVREQEIAVRSLIEASSGSAADAILAAQGTRWETHMQARGAAETYRGRLAAYQAAPEIVDMRLRLAEMAKAIENLRVYVLDKELQNRIRIDLKDVYLGTDVFDPDTQDL
ncbi:MAG: SPFH domain-containing protein [Planctomycetota bacterium]